jgi:hypothetical protein
MLVVLSLFGGLLAQACGGSGGGTGSSSGSNAGGGNGGGSGTTPAVGVATATPTPTPAPPPTAVPSLVVLPGESIANTAKHASAGATIIVSPGIYAPLAFNPGEIQDGLYFFADVSGEFAGTSPAPVIIDANGRAAAVELSSQSNVTFDSFTLRGGRVAGFLATSSPGTSLLDCIVTGNRGDGVQVDGADAGLIFNNLITDSGGAGVRVLGTSSIDIINNTIFNSAQTGLTVDHASTAVVVENNIFTDNHPSGEGIVVDAPAASYQGDFNLNTDGYRGTEPGPDDVSADPQFLFPANGDPGAGADFHLTQSSPAVDAGDANTAADLASTLEQLTTQSDGTVDNPPPDLGYHYPAPVLSPTPPPRATRTATPRAATPHPGTPTGTRRPAGTATPAPASAAGRTARPTKTPRG